MVRFAFSVVSRAASAARSALGLPSAGSSSVLRILDAVARLALALLRRVVAPPACAACDEAVTSPSLLAPAAFCQPCARSVQRIAGARPEVGSGGTGSSAEGASSPDVAFARYGGAVAEAVRRFKYGPRPDLAHPLGELLRGAARDVGLRADLIVPVPLHPARLRERGFNQAALLAAAVASEIGADVAARALVRVRATAAQASLDRAARLTNLSDAVRVRSPRLVRGRRVVLVDDVRTTGSTLDACRSALLAAGAERVSTLVLAQAEAPSAPARRGGRRSEPEMPVEPGGRLCEKRRLFLTGEEHHEEQHASPA